MILFLRLFCFGQCTGITFVDSTKTAVCHNKRISRNKVFAGIAEKGKSLMGWFYGDKLHLVCNDKGELLNFCLTKGYVDNRKPIVFSILNRELFGKLCGGKGYISSSLFDVLFNEGFHPVAGLRKNMKNRQYNFEQGISEGLLSLFY